MQKANIKLRELLSLITPAGRVRIYELKNQKPVELYNGFRANLVHEDKSHLLGREVQLFQLHPEFFKRKPEEKRARVATGEKLPLTPENAGEYNYADLCMKLYTDIYLF